MQGSFWASPYGSMLNNTSSPIDDLLENEDCTLEQLLDEDEVIQECNALNAKLIEFLSRPEVIRKLITFITVYPDEEKDEEKRRIKYPYVASELLASAVVSMLDVITRKEHGLLDYLLKFLDQDEPLDCVLAGYFRTAVVVLIQRKYEELVKFIRSREGVIDRIIHHIGTHSIMELLIMLGWDDGSFQDHEWLFHENVIPKLVEKLGSQYDSDVHTSAAYALVDVVAKCPPTQTSLLLTHLQSGPSVRAIVEHIFSGNVSSLISGLSVLIALVHRNANAVAAREQEAEVRAQAQADNEGYPIETEDIDDTDSLDEDADTNSSPSDKNELDIIGEIGETGLPMVIECVYHRLEDFEKVLKTPPEVEFNTQIGVLKPPLGTVRLKVVELLVAILRSSYEDVGIKIASLDLVPLCINLFFEFEWNNLLHGLVEHVIQMILSGVSTPLKNSLFIGAVIIDRILEAHRRNDEETQKARGFRLGFMGHITRISNTIVNQAASDEVLDQFCQDHPTWDEFVNGQLASENEKLNIQLGGHRPNGSFVEDSEDDFYDPNFAYQSQYYDEQEEAEEEGGDGYEDENGGGNDGHNPDEGALTLNQNMDGLYSQDFTADDANNFPTEDEWLKKDQNADDWTSEDFQVEAAACKAVGTDTAEGPESKTSSSSSYSSSRGEHDPSAQNGDTEEWNPFPEDTSASTASNTLKNSAETTGDDDWEPNFPREEEDATPPPPPGSPPKIPSSSSHASPTAQIEKKLAKLNISQEDEGVASKNNRQQADNTSPKSGELGFSGTGSLSPPQEVH